MNKSSLHHHIKTLAELGYLQQDQETRKYDIGLGLVQVGQSYLQRLDVRSRGHAYLEELSYELNVTTYMLVLDQDHVLYVDKVDIPHPEGSLKCSSFIGMRTDVYSTACGKVLLSKLDTEVFERVLDKIQIQAITPHTLPSIDALRAEIVLTRQRGYGLDLEEHSLGLQCVAVPIYDMNGHCIAAISVSSPVTSFTREALEGELREKLEATGQKISLAMGYKP